MSIKNIDLPNLNGLRVIEKDFREKFGENFAIMDYSYLEMRYKDLSGKILTIIDASMSDQTQRKAIKDLVKEVIWREIDMLHRDYYEGLSCLPTELKG